MDKYCAIALADQHTGHENGLLNPNSKAKLMLPIEGQDAYTDVPVTPFQEDMWELVETAKDWVDENCKDMKKIVVHHGEVCHGVDKYPENIKHDRLHTQVELAADTFKPWRDYPIRLLTGTGWHEAGQGSMAKFVGDKLTSMGMEAKVSHRRRIRLGDFIWDMTHKGPTTSKRKRLESNACFWEAHDNLTRYAFDQRIDECPDLTTSGHCHVPSMGSATFLSDGEFITSTNMVCPPLCGPGAYSRTLSKAEYTVGLTIIVVVDGKLHHIEPVFRTFTDFVEEKL